MLDKIKRFFLGNGKEEQEIKSTTLNSGSFSRADAMAYRRKRLEDEMGKEGVSEVYKQALQHELDKL